MDFEDYNPIFALHCQKSLRFLRQNGIFTFITILVLATVMWMSLNMFFERIQAQSLDSHLLYVARSSILLVIAFCGMVLATFPAVTLSQRTINQDLIHFTPLTAQQIINGYILIGALQNFLLCVCGFFVLAAFPHGSLLLLIQDFLSVGLVFLGTQTVVILLLPFYSIAEKPHHLSSAGFISLIAVMFFPFLLVGAIFSVFVYEEGWLGILYLAFILTAPFLGYHTAWTYREWRSPFITKEICLIFTYFLYFVVGTFMILLTFL